MVEFSGSSNRTSQRRFGDAVTESGEGYLRPWRHPWWSIVDRCYSASHPRRRVAWAGDEKSSVFSIGGVGAWDCLYPLGGWTLKVNGWWQKFQYHRNPLRNKSFDLSRRLCFFDLSRWSRSRRHVLGANFDLTLTFYILKIFDFRLDLDFVLMQDL